jgi:hypothetical protein
VLHRLTFGQAIERDLLSDYQVAVVVVSNPEASSRRQQYDCKARTGDYRLERPSPRHDRLRYSRVDNRMLRGSCHSWRRGGVIGPRR